MPISVATRIAKDAPTRFDLYTLEDTCKRLVDAVKDIAERDNVPTKGLEEQIEALVDQLKPLSTLSNKVEVLCDQVADLRHSIDDLARAVDKLPDHLGTLGRG